MYLNNYGVIVFIGGIWVKVLKSIESIVYPKLSTYYESNILRGI